MYPHLVPLEPRQRLQALSPETSTAPWPLWTLSPETSTGARPPSSSATERVNPGLRGETAPDPGEDEDEATPRGSPLPSTPPPARNPPADVGDGVPTSVVYPESSLS